VRDSQVPGLTLEVVVGLARVRSGFRLASSRKRQKDQEGSKMN
jgi:hypothetical protein